jgi:hypothetical protein
MANVQASQTRYIASVPPDTITIEEGATRELVRWMKNELDKVSQAISSLEHQYPPLAVEPERYTVGYVAYADGTNWNPGAGEGLYVYKSTGWTLLG